MPGTIIKYFRPLTKGHIPISLNKLFPEWTGLTRNSNINHDLETTPLQIITNTEPGNTDQALLYLANIGRLRVEFQRSRFYIETCGYRYFPPHMPEETNKIWTISRTKEALTILCNGVEVLNLVYAEVDKYCQRKWSKNSATFMLENGDLSSDYIKSMIPGKTDIFRKGVLFFPNLLSGKL